MSTATKRAAVVLAAGAFTLSLATTATTATAIPPHAEEPPGLAAVFPDFDNRLVGFLNFTRDEFCAWEASGYAGPPPYQESVSGWLRVTGTGEISGTARGEVPLELWPMNPEVAPAGPCEDTATAEAPFATGRADVRAGELALMDTNDGHGAVVGTMGFHGDLTAPDGSRYRYHTTVIELVDANGNVRHQDSAHLRLVELPRK